MYFVARTDVTGDSGEQRVFGVFDAESDAAAFGAMIAARRPGNFSVFEGREVVKLIREEAPVKAVQVISED